MSNSLPFPSPVPSLVGCEMIGLGTRMVDLAGETLTIVMEQFFDEVDVGENHSSTAVPFELKLVKGFTGIQIRGKREGGAQRSHPSVMSFARSSR